MTRSAAALLNRLPRPVGLLGYGEEGRATLRFLWDHGVRELEVLDRAYRPDPALPAAVREALRVHSGADYTAGLARCATIVRSPGVRPDLPALEAARARGARVTSAVRLFLAARPGPAVGVTGTVGKGTTVALIGEALRAAGRPHVLAGNLGTNPLACLDALGPEHVAVLELSSFQLMDVDACHPEVAVVLRTGSEHLDWHRDTDEYRRAKARLVAPPEAGQTVICCADSPGSREVAGERRDGAERYSLAGPVPRGIGVDEGGPHRYRPGAPPEPLPGLGRLALPGGFNGENAAAAVLAAEALGVPARTAVPAVAAFGGLPHRLERVGAVGGVECVNDSYATRPEATMGAVTAFPGRPVALILGGSDKGADFAPLAEALCRQPGLRRVLLMGATAERLQHELRAAAGRLGSAVPCVRVADLAGAFAEGLAVLPPGGVLLLSPACASFDMFADYKARGESFRALVARHGTGRAADGAG